MNGASFKESLVYYPIISLNNMNYKPALHKASCEASFEKRYRTIKKPFNVSLNTCDTKPSTEYWNFKMKQLNAIIS